MKRSTYYTISISIIALVVVAFFAHISFADTGADTNVGDSGTHFLTDFLGMPSLSQLVAETLANLFSTLQTIAAWIIALTGSLLNYSINLTLNIKTFVDNTPAIFSIWKAIRDISGMIIIFSLLWAALRLILGFDAKFGDLIKNIVIAGILINFSFFATGVGIDASNVISIQLYNTIAPANTLNPENMNTSNVEQLLSDGGLSDIFMKSLNATTLYNNSASLNKAGTADGGGLDLPVKIVIQGVTSILIMVTAAFSFFFAALAFMIRFVILLLLLAFSPIWFAAHVLPELKEYAKKWTSLYTGQLLFMPVYLLLMYFALDVMTKNPYLSNLGASVSGTSVSDDSKLIALVINAALVLIMMNIPLLAAIKIGGSATGWIEKGGYSKTFGTGISKWVGSRVARDTVGKAAYTLNDSRAVKKFAAALPGVGGAVSKGLGKVGNAGFGTKKGGYEDALKATKKDQSAMFKKIGTVDRTKYDSEEAYQKAKTAAAESQKAYAKNLTSNLTTPIKNWGADRGRDARIAEVDAKGVAHYGSEEEYQNARAEAAKTPFMSTAFNGKVGKVLSFMFDSRAHQESGFALTEEAHFEENKAEKKKIDEEIAEITEERITSIDEKLKKIADNKTEVDRIKTILQQIGDNPTTQTEIQEQQRLITEMGTLNKEILDIGANKEELAEEKKKLQDPKFIAANNFSSIKGFDEGERARLVALANRQIELDATIGRLSGKKKKEDFKAAIASAVKEEKGDEEGGKKEEKPKEEKPA